MKPSDLEYHIGYWLRFVSNHVSFSFRDRIATYDVTVAEWVALRSLHNRAPCTLGDLSEQIGIDLGATSRLVERLIKKKLASRKVSPEDRRYVTLDLSPAGKKLIPKLAKEADHNDAHFFNSLSKEDQNHLLRIMKNLVRTHKLTEKPTL
ncbi:MAG: MarR family winged helix-turn-helix transcriptional regulator [Bdellovibrionales bacterium]